MKPILKIALVVNILAVAAIGSVIPYVAIQSWKRDQVELTSLRDESVRIKLNDDSARLADDSIDGSKWRRIHYRSEDGSMEAWITFQKGVKR